MCRKFRNQELRDIHPSLRIIQAIKSKRMRWARHVARIGRDRSAYRVV